MQAKVKILVTFEIETTEADPVAHAEGLLDAWFRMLNAGQHEFRRATAHDVFEFTYHAMLPYISPIVAPVVERPETPPAPEPGSKPWPTST